MVTITVNKIHVWAVQIYVGSERITIICKFPLNPLARTPLSNRLKERQIKPCSLYIRPKYLCHPYDFVQRQPFIAMTIGGPKILGENHGRSLPRGNLSGRWSDYGGGA